MNLASITAMRSHINQSAIKGETGTGYESGALGRFACSNCEFYSGGTCGQPIMMKLSGQARAADGRVRVDPDGCCEYVDRKGGSL
jgi:hypothetical protein